MKPTVALINQSSVVTDAQAQVLTAALQVQVTRDYAPIWGQDASLVFVPRGQSPPAGSWWLVMLDDADQANALGYHEVTAQDKPLGKVFCKTTMQDGGIWTVTASHELLEMLGDPHINLAAIAYPGNGNEAVIFALENCDAVEADRFGYTINGTHVSDFVTPDWFDAMAPRGTAFDLLGHCPGPLMLLPGGYIGLFTASAGWTQKTADSAPHHSSHARYRGNRWHRRTVTKRDDSGRPIRDRSTAHADTPNRLGESLPPEFVRALKAIQDQSLSSPDGSFRLLRKPDSLSSAKGEAMNPPTASLGSTLEADIAKLQQLFSKVDSAVAKEINPDALLKAVEAGSSGGIVGIVEAVIADAPEIFLVPKHRFFILLTLQAFLQAVKVA